MGMRFLGSEVSFYRLLQAQIYISTTELRVRVLLMNTRIVCLLANPLKEISLCSARSDSGLLLLKSRFTLEIL